MNVNLLICLISEFWCNNTKGEFYSFMQYFINFIKYKKNILMGAQSEFEETDLKAQSTFLYSNKKGFEN